MPRILVIDDDALVSGVAKATLQLAGYLVNVASDGVEGLTLWATLSPHVVLLDIVMPGKTGLQVLEEARNLPTFARTPVIMMSARNRAADVRAAMSRGATDYLVKPFASEELLRKLRRALGPEQTLGIVSAGAHR